MNKWKVIAPLGALAAARRGGPAPLPPNLTTIDRKEANCLEIH